MTGPSWVERPAPSSWSWHGSRVRAAGVLTAATVLDYLVWLAWDQQRDVDPVTARVTGPYEPWQVVGVGAVLLVLALLAGWHRHAVLAVVVIPAVFTASWVIDAATEQTSDANLWPVGAVLLAVGSLGGTAIAAGMGVAARAMRDRPHPAHGTLDR